MDEKEFDSLNVVPLVDVMLVLLTIVLTTSTFVASGMIPVELPRVARASEASLRTRTLEVDRAGAVFLDGRAVSLDALRGALAALEREAPVLIRADRAVPLQGFVDVLQVVEGLGFSRVGVQTEERR